MFKTILIDPPYKMCSGGSKHINPKDHYPVQTKDEIIETIKNWFEQYPIAEEAHLYLWAINSYSAGYSRGIFDSLDIIDAIGFHPVTNLLWVKNKGNPTPYGRRCSEICIFATKHRKGKHREIMYKGTDNDECVVGDNLTKSMDWFMHPRQHHSKKPNVFYDLIEQRSNAPYLELYARNTRPNWTSIGNEV